MSRARPAKKPAIEIRNMTVTPTTSSQPWPGSSWIMLWIGIPRPWLSGNRFGGVAGWEERVWNGTVRRDGAGSGHRGRRIRGYGRTGDDAVGRVDIPVLAVVGGGAGCRGRDVVCGDGRADRTGVTADGVPVDARATRVPAGAGSADRGDGVELTDTRSGNRGPRVCDPAGCGRRLFLVDHPGRRGRTRLSTRWQLEAA